MRWSGTFPLCAALLVAGCGGGGAAPRDLSVPSTTDAARLDDLSSGGVLCSDPRADAWSLPIVKPSKGGLYTMSLVSADESPPIIGVNTWQMQLADADGDPLDGMNVTVKPWMPDMGHGTSVVPRFNADGSGAYTVTPLYFFMAGFWTTTFTIAGDGGTDTVVYGFCLANP